MATKIVTKNSSTASAVPTASDLVQGELAVNVADKRLFTEDNGGSIVELGTNPSSLTVSGDIDVDGTTNLDATNIVGALDVTGTATMDGLVVQQPSGANILLESTTTGATTGDIFGEIEFKTNDSSSAGVKGKIDSYSEGGVGNGALRLFTGNTTGLYERMRIDSSGNVGIGWSAPTSKLGIIAGGSSSPGFTVTDGSTSDLNVYAGFTSGVLMMRTSAGSMAFGTTNTERMRIDTSGNLLVGTTTASGTGKLTVEGGINLGVGGGLRGEGTITVSTSATDITSGNDFGALVIVAGNDAGAIFSDLVFFATTVGATVITGGTVSGGPAGRTYTVVSSKLKLAMASGTYSVKATAFTGTL